MIKDYRRAVFAGVLLVVAPAYAQKISQFPSMPGNAASTADAVVTQSNACAGGNCRTTVGQILGALANGSLVTSLTANQSIVLVPAGQTPQLTPLSALLAMLGSPSASSITGLAPSATIDTTNAANITAGTLPAARLPTPTSGTLGGVLASSGTSHTWISGISTSGFPVLSQPSVSDIAGIGTAAAANVGTTGAVVPLLSGSNVWSGGLQSYTGALTIGTPTGGAVGAGTLNAQGLFVNGVAVGSANSANGVASITSGTISGLSSLGVTGAATIGGAVTAASYKAGATAGVTCSGTPTSSFATVNGIVTHC